MRILGIETSCDETAAAVVENGKVLSNVISSQVSIHAPYAGVVPELASRAHLERLPEVLAEALTRAGCLGQGAPLRLSGIDAVAFTRGPGLAGALLVGKVAAETLARAHGVPVLGVHHLEGHVFAAELETPLEFPLLSLIVSGGHTDLVWVKGPGAYRVLGRTRDDAAGEAFDKVAKLLKIGFPGGPVVEKLGKLGDPAAIAFPRPTLDGTWDFSFSGLKTSVVYYLRDHHGLDPAKPKEWNPPEGKTLHDICASFQEAIVDTLVEKVRRAALRYKAVKIVIGGGVAANGRLREKMQTMAELHGLDAFFPRPGLCTDNGAMIAQVGFRRMHGHSLAHLSKLPRKSIDPGLPFENWGKVVHSHGGRSHSH